MSGRVDRQPPSSVGRLRKTDHVGREVKLPTEGEWISQAALSILLRRQDSEVRRWLLRREATTETGHGPRGDGRRYLIDEVLVDALEEWGYVITLKAAAEVAS